MTAGQILLSLLLCVSTSFFLLKFCKLIKRNQLKPANWQQVCCSTGLASLSLNFGQLAKQVDILINSAALNWLVWRVALIQRNWSNKLLFNFCFVYFFFKPTISVSIYGRSVNILLLVGTIIYNKCVADWQTKSSLIVFTTCPSLAPFASLLIWKDWTNTCSLHSTGTIAKTRAT